MSRMVLVGFLAMLAGCSGGEPDQAAIDAAVEKALAEREREAEAQGGSRVDASSTSDADKPDMAAADASRALSTEKLREGLSNRMGSAYWMCTRTLTIVGEHCGCMVNRATDAGISNTAQVGMFGGDGKRATKAQIAKFTRIVRSCAGYNITIEEGQDELAPTGSLASSTSSEPSSDAQGRVVNCSFDNGTFSYNGRCRFQFGPGGDFNTTSMDGPYFQNVRQIDLDVRSKGAGDIYLRYPDGNDVVVGVTRSTRDKACWEGPRLLFCAR
ncbi:MAG: hypothetical protein AAF494_06370 [Pseudomonadota bacterium]